MPEVVALNNTKKTKHNPSEGKEQNQPKGTAAS